jgi:integrase
VSDRGDLDDVRYTSDTHDTSDSDGRSGVDSGLDPVVLSHVLLPVAQEQPYSLLFATVSGAHLYGFPSPDSDYDLRGDFYPLLARAGLPRVRFHDLRHSTATLLMSLGIDLKIISEILGHSSVRITGDVYTHVSLEMQRPAAQAMDTLLRRRQANT